MGLPVQDIGAADGVGGDEIPVHRVAERLVDADAIHVDGDALRRALQRRSRKAAVAKILHEAVALDVGRRDARHALHQRVDDVLRIGAGNVVGGDRLHHGRDFVAVDAAAGADGGTVIAGDGARRACGGAGALRAGGMTWGERRRRDDADFRKIDRLRQRGTRQDQRGQSDARQQTLRNCTHTRPKSRRRIATAPGSSSDVWRARVPVRFAKPVGN